jgi:predicted lipoprotein with Yx(FWY)xxD motif
MAGRFKVLALVALLAVLMAACGDDSDTGSTGGASPTETAESPEPSETAGDESEGGEEEYTVEASSSDLGDIVTDSEGRTLYVFMADTSSESTCYEGCEDTWPALTVDGQPSAEGIDASLLGTSERTDGSTQVTLNGHPLYYYAPDTSPGDTNGQGVGGVWFVVSPAGDPIQS